MKEIIRKRKTYPSPFARSKGSRVNNENGVGWWWLRSPGSDGNSAAYVSGSGHVRGDGFNVNDNDTSVRPALWVKYR